MKVYSKKGQDWIRRHYVYSALGILISREKAAKKKKVKKRPMLIIRVDARALVVASAVLSALQKTLFAVSVRAVIDDNAVQYMYTFAELVFFLHF